MDDNKIRLKILYYLKSIYDKDIFLSIDRNHLIKDLNSENNEFEINEIIKNINYLDEKGFIDVD